jgi:putative flippase GtrA
MSFISYEFGRFILWGGINTLASYLIYALLLSFLPYLIAYSIAFIAGIFISYFLNSRFVFKQEMRLSKAVKYPLVYVSQYLLGVTSLYLFVQVLRVNKLLAAALAVILSIPVTFLLSRRIVRGKTGKILT